MSDAIEFGLGGNNKGFVAVLNDSEKKAKESTDRIKKEQDKAAKEAAAAAAKTLAESQKVAKEQEKSRADIIKDLAKVRSGGDLANVAISRMGTGLKGGAIAAAAIAAGATAVVATWRAVARETKEALENQLAMERIGRSSLGGTGERSQSDLQGNLEKIRSFRAENQKVLDGLSQSLFGEHFLKAGGQWLKEHLAATGDAVSRGMGNSGIEYQTPAQREEALRKAEETALNRIAKKQAEIWAVERVRLTGAREQAEILQIQAQYAEKIGAARGDGQKSGSNSLVEQLTAERDAVEKFTRNRQAAERFARRGTASNSEVTALASELSVIRTEEDAARGERRAQLAAAKTNAEIASKFVEASPGSDDALQQQRIAAAEVRKITAENAKWERDIARSKGDSVKMAKAENEAKQAELKGQRYLADLIRQRAGNELAIVQAQRAGNTELEKQLRTAGQIERRALATQRVMNGGRIERPSEVRDQLRRERMTASEADRAVSRIFDADGNLKRYSATVGRQPRRMGIHGSRSKLNALGIDGPRTASNAGVLPSTVEGSDAAEWRARFPKSRWANREMEHRQEMSAAQQAQASDMAVSMRSLSDRFGGSGGENIGPALQSIAQVVTSWNRKK